MILSTLRLVTGLFCHIVGLDGPEGLEIPWVFNLPCNSAEIKVPGPPDSVAFCEAGFL